jgi:indole-3-glycerol phosphate synthase
MPAGAAITWLASITGTTSSSHLATDPRFLMSSNPLDRIVARKRVEVARAKATTPIEAIRHRIDEIDRPRNFFRAVAGADNERTRVIAEIKRKSPSAGVIREDFDPVTIARQYHEAGAAAISCLTDEVDFGGHLGYVQRVRDAVPLPVLRKDFIVDQYQIWESRAAGADAILLIAEVLAEGELSDFLILATELGMTSLIEAHSVEKLLKVVDYIGFPRGGYSLLGINNRDLTTMTTDLSHTFRLLDFIEEPLPIVSESGIRTADDLARLRAHGIDIVLVGEHLMRQPDPGAALRDLLGEGDA